MIESDTIKLLRECDAVVKMGIASIDGVLDFAKSKDLFTLLDLSKKDHEKLKCEIKCLLEAYGDEGKNPGIMAKGMSYIKTNAKLSAEKSDNSVADLITDGCNMGVKSINKYLNLYKAADEKSKDIAKRISQMEERLSRDVRGYL